MTLVLPRLHRDPSAGADDGGQSRPCSRPGRRPDRVDVQIRTPVAAWTSPARGLQHSAQYSGSEPCSRPASAPRPQTRCRRGSPSVAAGASSTSVRRAAHRFKVLVPIAIGFGGLAVVEHGADERRVDLTEKLDRPVHCPAGRQFSLATSNVASTIPLTMSASLTGRTGELSTSTRSEPLSMDMSISRALPVESNSAGFGACGPAESTARFRTPALPPGAPLKSDASPKSNEVKPTSLGSPKNS